MIQATYEELSRSQGAAKCDRWMDAAKVPQMLVMGDNKQWGTIIRNIDRYMEFKSL